MFPVLRASSRVGVGLDLFFYTFRRIFCHVFHIEGLARGVFTVEAALPVVSQTPVMAGAYGADDRYAAIGATLSTIGCVVTIPILMLVLG